MGPLIEFCNRLVEIRFYLVVEGQSDAQHIPGHGSSLSDADVIHHYRNRDYYPGKYHREFKES